MGNTCSQLPESDLPSHELEVQNQKQAAPILAPSCSKPSRIPRKLIRTIKSRPDIIRARIRNEKKAKCFRQLEICPLKRSFVRNFDTLLVKEIQFAQVLKLDLSFEGFMGNEEYTRLFSKIKNLITLLTDLISSLSIQINHRFESLPIFSFFPAWR